MSNRRVAPPLQTAITPAAARPQRAQTPDDVAAAAQLACLLEASAEKPGNVTPTRGFADMTFEDFLRSAVAIGPQMARAGERAVGQSILAAVTATQRWTQANTNLGIILLFAPLARAALARPAGSDLRSALSDVLADLTVEDAQAAYTAIRLANPGGFDEEVAHDVRRPPLVTLREAMYSAAERDSIAAEYTSDYAITFERGLPALSAALTQTEALSTAIVQTYLQLLATVPDTLIARKQGRQAAEDISSAAEQIVSLGGVFGEQGRRAISKLDEELRREGNSLNPGTTADLVAATLFVALLEGMIE